VVDWVGRAAEAAGRARVVAALSREGEAAAPIRAADGAGASPPVLSRMNPSPAAVIAPATNARLTRMTPRSARLI